MVWVIVAGVLGAISVTGGLFLRRLLGEITELRRQITGIDREMRAQRARVKFLRHLLDNDRENKGDEDDRPPDEAAVANGGIEQPPHAAGEPEVGPAPVRRKKHLGLYLGGAVAALASISEAARITVREHQGQLIGTVTGAAVTAATVTIVTVQPWTTESSNGPPSFAPTVSSPPTYQPPPGTYPPPFPGTPPGPSPSPSPSEAQPSASPSASPSESISSSPPPTSSVVPVDNESPPPESSPTPPGGGDPGDTGTPPASSGPSPSPPPRPPGTPEPPPPTAADPPPAEASADALCLGVTLPPQLDVDACLLS